MSDERVLNVEKLSKSVGAKKLLRDISFSISSGEIVLLSGDNGAGKSTLLQILGGIQSQDAGTFRYESDLDRFLGYVGHKNMFYEDLTLKENLKIFFQLRASVIPEEELRSWGLSELLRLPVRKLSQGQALKASLFRALYAGSQFLLFDEPSASLDVHARALFSEGLQAAIHPSRCRAAFMVTHDPENFRSIASRQLQLAEGRIFEHWKQGN